MARSQTLSNHRLGRPRRHIQYNKYRSKRNPQQRSYCKTSIRERRNFVLWALTMQNNETAAQACNTSRSLVWYWKKRYTTPTFKSSNSWGGFRKATFLPTEKVLAQEAVLHLLNKNPFLRLGALASLLSSGFQRRVTRSTLSRILTPQLVLEGTCPCSTP